MKFKPNQVRGFTQEIRGTSGSKRMDNEPLEHQCHRGASRSINGGRDVSLVLGSKEQGGVKGVIKGARGGAQVLYIPGGARV